MKITTLALTGALTLGLLAPAGAAMAAATDDHPNPVRRVLSAFGDHDKKNDKKSDRKHDRKAFEHRQRVDSFLLSGTIRAVDTDERTITVGHDGTKRTVKVTKDARIWLDGDKAKLGDLSKGDTVRLAGKKHGKTYTTGWIHAKS